MKRLLLFLIGCLAYAKLEIVAVTHKDCPVCKRWHDEVYVHHNRKAITHAYPKIKLYDVSEPEGQAFIAEKLGYISVIPLFIIMDEEVISRFDGYSDHQTFYDDLEDALKLAPRDGLEPPTK